MSMAPLVTALLDLTHELPDLPKPLLIGGGFGLYLKQRDLEDRDIQTLIPGEFWPPARATEDIDLVLPVEIISSRADMQALRNAFDRLGYVSDVDFLQFTRQTPMGPVKVDFLTGDIPRQHRSKVKISRPRVRPKGGVRLHAYLTPEALALESHSFELTLRGVRSNGEPSDVRVCIPNPFTYLLMKLHAFRDRADDEQKQLARHHSLDVFRIVAMLTRPEFDLVKSLRDIHAAAGPVTAASGIVQEYFADGNHLGVLRLRAELASAGVDASHVPIDAFVSAITALFPP